MKKYYLDDGSKIVVDPNNPLGKGGEGTVYTLHGEENILLKVYSKRALNRMPDIKDKVTEMVKKKPSLLTYQGLTIIAWPAKTVYDSNHNFVGYLMHRVNAKNHLSHVITPGLQKRKFPDITWKDRLVVAINLALVLDQIHKNDAVIGDINTSDFFVYPGLEIGVVDTDSFQFKSNQGRLFHCNVFTPDYTPPEIIRAQKSKRQIERTANNDNYGLAILIFQILMSGVHPFSARISQTLGFDGNAINYCMENEIFPYHTKQKTIKPPKNAMPLLFLPETIQAMFISAFKPYQDGELRPTSEAWVQALRTVKENLKQCRKKKAHYFPNHFRKCPLCEREKSKDYDHLLNKYSKTQSHYTVLTTADKTKVFVHQEKELFKTLSGKYMATSKRKRIALLFSKALLSKHAIEDRIDQLLEHASLKSVRKHTLVPLEKLYEDDRFCGILLKKRDNLYPLEQFIKASRLGRLSITEKVKVMVAEHVASLFQSLEKEGVMIEYEHLYIDKSLNIVIPDFALLTFKGMTIPQVSMHPDDYYPQEYYLYQNYMDTLAQLKQSESLEEKEAATKPAVIDIEEAPQEDQGFMFEQSARHLEVTENKKTDTVVKIEQYSHRDSQPIRFRLAIILHRILANVHPFEGHYNQAKKESSFFIKNNLYLHKNNDAMKDIKDSSRVIEEFPINIEKLFEQALMVKNPKAIKRPSPRRWVNGLRRYRYKLKRCKQNLRHYYKSSLYRCPLCFRENEKATLETMRDFCKEEKKTKLDYFVAINLGFNKIILASILIAMIFTINANLTSELAAELQAIDIATKQAEFLALIRFEVIRDIFANILNGVRTIWQMIAG